MSCTPCDGKAAGLKSCRICHVMRRLLCPSAHRTFMQPTRVRHGATHQETKETSDRPSPFKALMSGQEPGKLKRASYTAIACIRQSGGVKEPGGEGARGNTRHLCGRMVGGQGGLHRRADLTGS